MKNGRMFGIVPLLVSTIAVVGVSVTLVSAIYFTQISPQWITFLTGVLVAATLAAATRASRSEWVVLRRTAQLSAIKSKLEKEIQLRKKAENAISASKSRLHLMDTALPVMVALVDNEGFFRYCNQAFMKMMHMQPEQINGRHMRDVLGTKVYQEIAAATRQSLAGHTVRYERTHTLPNGAIYKLSVEHLPQFGEDAKVGGFYMVMQDITTSANMRQPAASADSGRAGDAAAPAPDSSTADQDMFIDSFSEQITGLKNASSQIMKAIENNEFCLFCQLITPLVAGSGDAEHYEVLVRLWDEEESMIPPGAFFPLAEKLGLMSHLDRWVVRHVAEWVASHNQKERKTNGSMYFINVAKATICDPGFPEFLQLTLQEYGISGTALCFEISNSELASSNADVARFARQVRECGCRIALGGFGRDRVLFDMIRGFQVEFLKIDGGIILDIQRDPVALAKVTAVSQVARKIGVKTVAEFVESQEIIASLKKAGIDFAQGFGVSHPQPLADLVQPA